LTDNENKPGEPGFLILSLFLPNCSDKLPFTGKVTGLSLLEFGAMVRVLLFQSTVSPG
jgi:hypothetical protein